MARSPLFRLVQKALRRARAEGLVASGQGAAPSAGGGPAGRSGIDRRAFVRAAAAGGALALASACARRLAPAAPAKAIAARTHGLSVLVVGAGIAGLTAAHRLRQQGVPFRLVEAQARVGGRVHTLRGHFPDGLSCELGGELIDTGHVHLHRLVAELGLRLEDYGQDTGWARDTWWFQGVARTQASLVEAVRPLAAAMDRALATLEPGEGAISYRTPRGAQRLDALSVAAWLDGAGVTGWVRALLAAAYTTEYGRELEEQSALNLLLMFAPRHDPPQLYGESDERFHVQGGNDRIATALRSSVDPWLETETALEQLRVRDDGSFDGSLRQGGRSVPFTATHVILALPFTVLRQVRLDVPLPPAKRRAIEALGYGHNAKLMAGFSDRVWRTRHHASGDVLTDLPFQNCWDSSRLQPGRAGILTNFTGGNHGLALGQGAVAARVAEFVAQADQALPGLAAAHEGQPEARFHWPSQPHALGSYACYGPGQWTSFGGAEGEPVGRLLFAGEHCGREAQGFMEGACESGERAAAQVLLSAGLAAGASPSASSGAPS